MLRHLPDLLSSRSASRTILAVRLTWLVEDQAQGSQQPLEIARRVVMDHGGKIASTSLDGLIAELQSPTDTLQCAAALQDRFALERSRGGSLIYARTAVTIGEVLRDQRGLSGRAVDQANLLAEKASPGEVLFTHAVLLAITQSEVSWEVHPGPELGIAQQIHRLLPQPGVGQGELPYGGAGLERGPSNLVDLAARETSDFVAERLVGGRAALVRLAHAPAWLRQNLAPLVTALLLTGMAAAGAILIWPPWAPPQIEAALRSGHSDHALLLADGWLARGPDRPVRRAWLGRVLAHRGELDEARELLDEATARAPRLARSPGLAWALVLTLDAKGAESSLLRRNRGPALERALVDATHSRRYWLRWNAVATLEKFGLRHEIDRVAVYSLDLQHGASCGVRVRAAKELARLGDSRAIPLLQTARADGHPNAVCNLMGVAADALRTLGSSASEG